MQCHLRPKFPKSRDDPRGDSEPGLHTARSTVDKHPNTSNRPATGRVNQEFTMAASESAPTGDLTLQVLQTLSKQSPILTAEAFPAIAYEDIKAALTRLAGRAMITYETIEREEAILEPEAEQIAAHGSHEARVFEAVRQAMEGLTIPDLEKAIGDKTVTKLGQGKAFKEKWIAKGKDGKLTATVCSPPN